MNSLCASSNIVYITWIDTGSDAPLGSLTFSINFLYGRTRDCVSFIKIEDFFSAT